MFCGTDVSYEVVHEEGGPGTGESIYTTSTGYRFIYSVGRLPEGFYWKPTNSGNTQYIYNSNQHKTQAEIEAEKFAAELAKILKRQPTWKKPFHDPPVYKPRFRRVQMLTKQENRARSHPVHVRNIKWDPRERA